MMGSSSDSTDGEDAAFGVNLEFPNEPLEADVSFRQIGKKSTPVSGPSSGKASANIAVRRRTRGDRTLPGSVVFPSALSLISPPTSIIGSLPKSTTCPFWR